MEQQNWIDSTTYTRNDKNRVQSAWTLKNKHIKITVMNKHRYYPGKWVLHCFSIGIKEHILGCAEKYTVEQAKQIGLKIVKNRLQSMLDSIS